jgi:hypothetical protein
MDRHFNDISVGLYLRDMDGEPVGIVHSFSGRDGVRERLQGIAATVATLGGLEVLDDGVSIRFPCSTWHSTAAKRLFLEACKHDPAEPLEPKPLEAPDSRTEQTIRIEPLGDGAYQVLADNVAEGEQSRAPAIGRAMAKLAQLEADDGGEGDRSGAGEARPLAHGGDRVVVRFACGHAHDELIGLLLGRAQNLRAVLREEEMKASRGVLAAPSAQE